MNAPGDALNTEQGDDKPFDKREIKRETAKSAKIFISYRRADASWPARWLTDRLVDQFGSRVVFQDVDSIRSGDDFAAEIVAAVETCSALLAVIGPRWLTVEGDGGRRIDDPQDWVRLEIETALNREIRVIPVLVDEAKMPSAYELPPSLQSLAGKQAVVLNHISLDIRSLVSHLSLVNASDHIPAYANSKQSLAELPSSAKRPHSPPGPSSESFSPENARKIDSDMHLKAGWGLVNSDIKEIYEVLGPPPLRMLLGVHDEH